MINNHKKGNEGSKKIDTLDQLYKDIWNEIIQFFDKKEDFFNSTLICKAIRNEIMSKSSYIILFKNVSFSLEKDVDISNLTYIHDLRICKKDFLTDDIKYFPKSIRKLTLINCDNFSGEILNTITLKSLHVDKCSGFLGDKLPTGINSLYVVSCSGFIGDKLPTGINSLEVYDCSGFIGDKLPTGINSLKVDFCHGFIGDKLPTGINSLNVDFCHGFIGDKLPTGINSLNVDFCHGFIGDKLPTGINSLKVYDCSGFIGDKLPSKLIKKNN